MTTNQVIEAVRGDLYAGLDCFTQTSGTGRRRTTRLVDRRTGRVLIEGSGVRTRQDLLRSLALLSRPAPAWGGEYADWAAETLGPTLPARESQGEPS